MFKYILRRLIQAVPIFFGITLLSFLLMYATPGNPVTAQAFSANMRAVDVERLTYQLGANDGFVVQYLRWLVGDDWMRWDDDGDGLADGSVLVALETPSGERLPPGIRRGILRGDFGVSLQVARSRPVLDILVERMPATLELGVASLFIGATVGVTIGVLAAVQQGKLFDHITRIISVVFDAVPVFFLGLLLLLVFAQQLKILPLADRCPTTISMSCPPLFERLQYLILPTFVLATGIISLWSRFVRASMLDVVSQDYIRTAHAKGLSARRVWFQHGMRNALIPVATFLGPSITGLLGGAAITETIFNWPGVGRMAVAAVGQRDYPVVMAVTVYAGIATILGYLISDILYGAIDPRIRFN